MSTHRSSRTAEWFRDRLSSDGTKLLLSLLIIVSVLPFPFLEKLWLPFFGFFAIELYGRSAVLRDDLKRHNLNRVELVFLAIDFVAVISFLPLEAVWHEARDLQLLRLLRLCRMLLLLRYWGPMAREIWTILSKRERRFQLFFVGASVVILSFLSAVLLFHFSSGQVDFNGDGDADNDNFVSMLWWSFRQVEDPGNLVDSPNLTAAFVCSVVLTISGLFVFTFLIGIANSVVEELVRVARERPLGMRRHSVICNIDEYARFLLEELVAYYTKGLRQPRIITMGTAAGRYHFMLAPELRRIRYRQGRPLSRHDLQKVDVDRATRVILRGYRDREASDSEIVSQILSVRQLNPNCAIYAEILRGDNVRAAIEAGGQGTVPILTNRFAGRLLARMLVFPGVKDVHDELLSSAGAEIYSCLYGVGALKGTDRPDPMPSFEALLASGYRTHGVVMLGYLVADPDDPLGYQARFAVGHDHVGDKTVPDSVDPSEIRGMFGLSPVFDQLRDVVAGTHYATKEPRKVRRPKAEVPRFAMCPVATQLSKLLVCGFHEGLIDFCVQAFFYAPDMTIYIMVANEDQVAGVVNTFVQRPREGLSSIARSIGFAFSSAEPGQIRCRAKGCEGLIHVIVGDWSNERTMVAHPASGYRLSEVDAVVFTFTPGEQDPDARTALGLLKLIHLKQTREAGARQDLRILCEVQSREKGELLERRFAAASEPGQPSCQPLSIVSAETIRDAVLAQAVLIPGIAAIYRCLLGEGGPEICKLLPHDIENRNAKLTFEQLITELYRRDGLIPLAVELEDAEHGRRTVTCPEPGSYDARFRAGDIVSVLAIGEATELAAHERPCESCSLCGGPAE